MGVHPVQVTVSQIHMGKLYSCTFTPVVCTVYGSDCAVYGSVMD